MGFNMGDLYELQARLLDSDDPVIDPPPDDPPPVLPDAPSWLLPLFIFIGIAVGIVIFISLLAPRVTASAMEVSNMEQAFEGLINWLMQTTNVTALPFALTLGTLLTGLTKMFVKQVWPEKYKKWMPSGQLTALIWQVGIWTVWMGMRHANFEEQFIVFGTNFTPIAIMLVNSLLGTKFQSVIYDRYLANKVTAFGYKRS